MIASFADIEAHAAERHGGLAQFAEQLPEPKSADALRAIPDRDYLSRMSFRVFSAGLRASMIEAKWPAFEEVFHGFEPRRVRAMSDEDLEALMGDTRIVRHWGKIKATRHNAAAMCDVADEAGGFGDWLAGWPADDAVGLWEALGKRFSQLGGNSGPYFLRWVGKDTFVLTGDVGKALVRWGGMDAPPKGKKATRAAQELVNAWAAESGRPLCQVSRILALSVD